MLDRRMGIWESFDWFDEGNSAWIVGSQLFYFQQYGFLVTVQISQESFSFRYSCSSVTPEKQGASDKCSTDIAVLIFLYSGACLLLWATGFILHGNNKNNRPVKDAPVGISLPFHPEEQFTQDLGVWGNNMKYETYENQNGWRSLLFVSQ